VKKLGQFAAIRIETLKNRFQPWPEVAQGALFGLTFSLPMA
jgi:hypothetical protein